jgi:NADH-quinone oxidoreductase subunit E
VMIFKDTYEDLTPERLAEIIDAFEAGKGDSVKPGPQVGRIYAAPQSGLTTLKDETAVLKSTRDREAAERAKAEAPAGGEADVPPSQAAKPKTDAIETSPAIKSPSPEKVSPAVEKAASAAAPAHDPVAANRAEPAVEGAGKQRRSRKADKDEDPARESPKLLRGEPIGPAGKRPPEDLSDTAEVGLPSPEAPASARRTGGKRAEPSTPKPSLEDPARPRGMERPSQVDDLQLISGVGPKIEGTLHSLGIYTYAQIASWKKAERQWVDGYLNFHGRIEREDWVKQAKALAKGGEAEYVRVFGKKPR